MQRNVKAKGDLLARVAWLMREGLISLIVLAVEAVRWLYDILVSLPTSKICCLTTYLVCSILVCLSLEPYYNGPLFFSCSTACMGSCRRARILATREGASAFNLLR